MAAIIDLSNNSFISIIYEQKINILGGIFLGLAVYSYFYKKKKVIKEIIKLKKESIILEIIKNNLIDLAMSETEIFTLKEMVGSMFDDFKEFKTEIRQDIKDLIKSFSDYKISNNHRISLLEGDQKTTTKTIAIYIGFVGMFIMLAINTYMSFKG